MAQHRQVAGPFLAEALIGAMMDLQRQWTIAELATMAGAADGLGLPGAPFRRPQVDLVRGATIGAGEILEDAWQDLTDVLEFAHSLPPFWFVVHGIRFGKTGRCSVKGQIHLASRTVTLLNDEKLCYIADIRAV